jgi:hypothetical protein
MPKTTSLTLATLLVVAVAGSAAPTLAQDIGPGDGGKLMVFRHHGDGPRLLMRRMHSGESRGAGLIGFACSEDGTDRLEHTLLTMEQRTDVTATQRPLFDAFETAAKAAQAHFAAACTAARPAEGERGGLDLAERLNMRLEVQKARVAAMETVLPAFTEFYASLSDAQKAALHPLRGPHHRDIGEVSAPELPGAAEPVPELIDYIDG